MTGDKTQSSHRPRKDVDPTPREYINKSDTRKTILLSVLVSLVTLLILGIWLFGTTYNIHDTVKSSRLEFKPLESAIKDFNEVMNQNEINETTQ